MSEKYQIKVNNTFDFEFTKADLDQLDAIDTGRNSLHVLSENTPYEAEIVAADFNHKKYTVAVSGNNYEVEISNEFDVLIKDMGFEIGATKEINMIMAPMPGLILEISVTEGQEVKQNDHLLILEAMKMENSFLSPRDGIIKSIAVVKGDAVDKGQLLIEFE